MPSFISISPGTKPKPSLDVTDLPLTRNGVELLRLFISISPVNVVLTGCNESPTLKSIFWILNKDLLAI